ncbi:HNH endonuclease [Saccharothrix xinjiangensis]|uniref:HNH endonuclease n=1 Tax=Saccharothrix xinjiangensis TaxID=204798 RepID=A0ABV9XSJ5_9PSEU
MAYTDVGVEHVLRAIALFDEIGREEFLQQHGYKKAREYLLAHNGREYDSKAIVGVAHGFVDGERPLAWDEFSGGASHAAGHLCALGFEVRGMPVFSAEAFLSGLLATHRERVARAITLLWAVGRAADRGAPPLHTRHVLRDEVGRLLADHGQAVEPDRVVRGLAHPGLWVAGQERAGFVAPVHGKLRREVPFRTWVVNAVRLRLLDGSVDHEELLAAVGLAGHATVSGVAGTASPAERRERTVSAVVRDPAHVKRVKRWYDDRCQFCGTRLSTAFGHYSEAAHIRGLGLHGGPDQPANMLCLCANCHVEFDHFALYVDEGGVVRRVRDRSEVGRVLRHPEHHVDEAHFAYHRELCVIDLTPA